MAILDAAFISDFAQIKADDGSYSPIPAGEYVFQLTGAELKQTKDGSGQYIKGEFTVIAPSYQGRKVFQNFNIYNRNSEAERIGRSQLKALAIAVGLDTLRDTDELIGRTVAARVSIEKDKSGRYDDQNRLSKYKPADTSAPAASPMAAPMPADGGSFAAAFGGGMAGPHATTGGFAFK